MCMRLRLVRMRICVMCGMCVHSTPRILAARTILRAEKGDRRFYRLRHMRSAASALFRRAPTFVEIAVPVVGGHINDRVYVNTCVFVLAVGSSCDDRAARDRAVIRMCWCG